MAYNYIFPSECLGDSLYKINNNAADFDTRIVDLTAKGPRRGFDQTGENIWIDSGPLGSDESGDGTKNNPFKTIAAAVTYYSKFVASNGYSAKFRLVAGTSPATARVYKGAQIDLAGFGAGGALRNKDVATALDPYQTYPADRSMYFIGTDFSTEAIASPGCVVIEPLFVYSRTPLVDFWNAYGLNINWPGGSVIVQGITFRYNAINNLPGYTGVNQQFNDKTDIATHLVFKHCNYAAVDKCVFEQLINSNTYDISDSGFTGTKGLVTQVSNKYMFGIEFNNCRYGKIREITVTGDMRSIAKCNGSEISFEAPGVITLQNTPRFYGLFEIENGGSIIVDPIYTGSGFSDSNYSLRFTGNCASPLIVGGKQWFNYGFVNFNSKNFAPQGGPRPQGIQWPSRGATPSFVWRANTSQQLLWPEALVNQTGLNNNVFYQYVDSGKTPGTGSPRNV